RVRLVDRMNAPLAGEIIRFKAMTFGAKFGGSDSVNVLTDSQGYASARPTLGTAAGDTIYVFEAHAQAASGSPVIFKASAIPGPPTRIEYVSGNNQTGSAGKRLPEPLKVRLFDVLDNPVKNYEVRFAVTEGGGSFNGESSIVVLSDAQGFAQAYWQLGPRTGRNSAVAAAVGTPLPQINFTAVGTPGPAARLVKSGGDNQRGIAGQALNEYFVVTVTDSFFNPIANHPVTFRVVQGGGTLNGRTEITEYTNAFGQAQALYTMGPTEYEQRVEATALRSGIPLIDSPQVFRAFLAPGDPETLLYISGNNQIGRINTELLEPFVVRVVDRNGIGVNNVEVTFVSYTPGAGFSGSPSVKKMTNADGYAQATATLGSNYGTNNYVFEAVARFNGRNLRNSPLQFFASGRISLAKKMRKVNGEQVYSGTVGQVLADSLQVQVLDAADRPVAGHPVIFQVISGRAFLDGQRTTLETVSNSRGIAGIAVRLDTRPGNVTIRASSTDGVDPLTPAFLEFSIETLVGPPDPETCSITAVSNVVADGQTASPVTVRLRDRYNNPIVSQMVTLQASGLEVFISQPTLPTDSEGVTRGSVTSINIGKAAIYALVDQQPILSTIIEFIAGPPALVSVLNAGQSQEKGKTLPQPVGVLVQDAWAHPVKNIPVHFTVLRGGGSIKEPQPVLTAEDGRAMVTWTLGDTLSDANNEQKLRARIQGIEQPVDIIAYALPPAEGRVRIVSGDSLIALVNQPMPAAFRVKVTDPSGKPITNFPVDFSILQGQGEWLTSTRPYTDQQGEAQALLRAGTQQGLHLIRANAGNYGAVLFTAIVQEQRTITLVKLSPDGLQVRPQVEISVSVKALDAFNRPLQNESIQVMPTLGQGYIKETMPLRTGSDGTAKATWVVGLSGTQQIEFRALNAVHPPVTYTIIVVNSAPTFSPPLQRNRTVEAGNLLQFQIKAVDPDGDQVFYSVRNLPQGAQFDAETTQTFRWTPTNADAGDHLVTFRISDPYHAADSTVVRISVVARNSAPQILGFSPADTLLILPFNTPLSFEVQAVDPDNDPLSYAWMVSTPREELFAGDQPELPVIIFSKQAFPDSFAVVRVIVSDGSEQVSKSWRIHLSKLAAVELESFTASVKEGRVELVWRTKSVKNLLGFTIQRGRSKEGPFTPINTSLIIPRTDGVYSFIDERVQAGERWYYQLLEHETTGTITELGLVEAIIELPKEFALRQNYPNPFNPTTTIQFELPAARPVKLAVYSLTGKIIRILAEGEYPAGIHTVVWDARDESGQPVPTGIYYCRITAGEFSQIRKMTLLK
ncbi:MAG: Ig-like domain-containing protein, partial [candidate division KSB1 bacterium]|nr:Ig-like domain-containing protein [candidate division KSB1 bacterium]